MIGRDMNFIYLKYFYDAAMSKSISASAKVNFVSQSAVSQGILKLEQILKKPLITHRRNAFKLTREGEIVFEACKKVFQSITELTENLAMQEDKLSGNLHFACSHSIALSLLPMPLAILKQRAPLVKPSFRLANTSNTMNLVRQGIIEFGIVLDNTDLSGFEKHKLDQGEFRLYCSKKFKLRDEIPTEFLLTEEQKEIHLLKDSFKQRYGKELAIQMEISSWEVIAGLIQQGVGIGFIPDFLVREKRRKNSFQELDLDLPAFSYNIYAICPKREKLSKTAEFFLGLFSISAS